MKMRFQYRFVAIVASSAIGVGLLGEGEAVASPRAAAVLASQVIGQQPSLDLPEEAEEPPLDSSPPSENKTAPSRGLDEEEPPLNSPPPSENKTAPSRGLDEEEAPLTPQTESGKVIPLDLGSEEPSDGEAPEEPVCDIVVIPPSEAGGTRRSRQVKLITEELRLPLPPNVTYEFHVLNSTGKGTRPVSVKGAQIDRVEYYEQRMLKKAADEFKVSVPQLKTVKFDVSDSERANAAPRVVEILKLAMAEHDSAVQRFLRPRKPWTANLRSELGQSLLNVQMFQIRLMIAQGRAEEAAAECDRLRPQLYGGELDALQTIYEDLFLRPAIEAGRNKDYAAVRDYLDQFSSRFPQKRVKLADDIRSALIQRAQLTAQQAAAESDPRERVRLLEEAGKIWPQLIGLDSELRKVQEDYPVLEIAYTSLPKNFSPLNVSTPVERHAAALLFESLVQWTEQSPAGPHYASQLAEARPAPLARGRQFRLPQCGWSDTEPNEPHLCTAEDIRWTLDLYKKVRPAGFSPAWGGLVKGVQSEDPFAVSIRLAVDHWQPLSLMDFMIVPKRYFPGGGTDEEIASFNSAPVGTGPYRLLDQDNERVRFQANPFYRKAPDGLPRIREISFNSMDPVKAFDDFQQGKIHLIYGVPREQVVQLEQTGKKVVPLPARSVYFLAPNYRKETILQLPEVRLAIANAINRAQILDTVFRPGQHRDRCAELNGPYPVGSWAYNPDAPKYNVAQAKVQLRSVKDKVDASGPLRLVHPERDPDAVRACQEIAVQVEKELGIKLALEGVEPNLFYDQIVRQHNFDLVYWRHDFDDESYWIWPLFDPNDKDAGGANFMGIDPEANLRTVLFDTAKQHKDFTRVRELAHLAHAEIARSAAIIPLWQLNTHVAVSPLLRDAVFDPVYLFEDVEQWSLASGGRSSR